jgi:hypothetical protein
MKIDQGEIRGGFERNYEAVALDQKHCTVASIDAAVGVRRDALDVRIERYDKRPRVVTLQGVRGWDSENCLFTTPNPDVLGARAYGVGFAVNTASSEAPCCLVPDAYLSRVFSDLEGRRIFMVFDGLVACFDGKEIIWTTRRPVGFHVVSSLGYRDGVVFGEGDDAFGKDVPFEIDADSGEVLKTFEWPDFRPI